MPRSKREGWINSISSIPKTILLEDLISGVLPLDETELSAEEAWELCYQHMAEFVPVVFSQFEARLKDHRRQVKKDMGRSMKEQALMERDRLLFPRKHVNERGEIVFDMHPAKELLRDDVKNKRYANMSIKAFRLTRDEYKVFTIEVFRRRFYQAIRYQKFVNYLEDQRKRKGKLFHVKKRFNNTI